MKICPVFLSVIITASLALSACTRTDVISVWKKQDFIGPPLQSVVILAETGKSYNRLAWENTIAEHFRRKGMYALPAVSIYQDTKHVTPDEVLAYTQKNQIDGVLVVRHVDTRTEERYHPPETRYYYTRHYYPHLRYYHYKGPVPYRDYPYYLRHYPRYRPYFFYEEDVFVIPAYTSFHKIISVESYLYNSYSREQVWWMMTETTDSRSTSQLLAEISGNILRSLQNLGLIRQTR